MRKIRIETIGLSSIGLRWKRTIHLNPRGHERIRKGKLEGSDATLQHDVGRTCSEDSHCHNGVLASIWYVSIDCVCP